MVKITIMSDDHGRWQHVDDILEREKDSDYFIHCGDHAGADSDLNDFIAVRGNSDYVSNLPYEEFLEVEGLRIGIIHGHKTGCNTKPLLKYMEQKQLDVVIHGHTHCPRLENIEGKWIINPGSTARPRSGSKASYAIIFINNGILTGVIKDY